MILIICIGWNIGKYCWLLCNCVAPVVGNLIRQMRNRDSAMKSRERKKMYVKELEIKTRYLESECRRLSYAIQCCTAENMALRHRLHAEGPLGAHVAVQESAVLFVGKNTLPTSMLFLLSLIIAHLLPTSLANG